LLPFAAALVAKNIESKRPSATASCRVVGRINGVLRLIVIGLDLLLRKIRANCLFPLPFCTPSGKFVGTLAQKMRATGCNFCLCVLEYLSKRVPGALIEQKNAQDNFTLGLF
jgi:hypothetical protein